MYSVDDSDYDWVRRQNPPRTSCGAAGHASPSHDRAMTLVDSPSDIPPLTDAEIQDLYRRQRRSTRVLVVLIALVLVIGLVLPVIIGIATHGLLSYYGVAPPLMRIWLSVGASVVALILIHVVVMIPLTMFMATQSTRLHAAFEGAQREDRQAQKLISTLADASASSSMEDRRPSQPTPPDPNKHAR